MNTKRPVVITIGAILLLVLSLFVAGLGFANQFGLLGRGFGTRQFVQGQAGNRNFTPPNGFTQNGSPQNGLPDGQNNSGTRPNFIPNRRSGTGITTLFRLIQPLILGLDILMLILSVVAAIGLFKSKRWGAILAIIISILFILLTIPGLLRIFSSVVLIENLARILLAVGVIVLLLLPPARKAYANSMGSEEEQAERIVR